MVENSVRMNSKSYANKQGLTGSCQLLIIHKLFEGKNTKNTFPSSESKAKGILEIIHSDVCSPMSSSSLSGYVYYVSFIDDFFRKTWIYFMKNKDEVFNKFKDFKALIKIHTEKKIKTFQSDNGR